MNTAAKTMKYFCVRDSELKYYDQDLFEIPHGENMHTTVLKDAEVGML